MKTPTISRTNATIAWVLSGFLFANPLLAAPGPSPSSNSGGTAFPENLRQNIKHVLIIYLEGRSFDNLYGQFPRANGIAQASNKSQAQLTQKGLEQKFLFQPKVIGIPGVPVELDNRFNNKPLPNTNLPYDLQPFVSKNERQPDMLQEFYTEQYQINDHKNGRFKDDPKNAGGEPMSKFGAWSNNPGVVMGHYNTSDLAEWRLAKEFVLCDNAFHSAFGDSFLNHMWLIAARTPVWRWSWPIRSILVKLFEANVNGVNGVPLDPKTGSLNYHGLTRDPNLRGFKESNVDQTLEKGSENGNENGNAVCWAMNDISPLGFFPFRGPAGGLSTIDPTPPPPTVTVQPQTATFNQPNETRLSLQNYDTIGDRLDKAGKNWAWYSQGWNDAKAGKANYAFQFTHQPFAHFTHYALKTSPVPASPDGSKPAIPGTDSDGSKEHLKDLDADFFKDLKDNKLPAVSFIKPIGQKSKHPGIASLKEGDDWLNDTVTKIRGSDIFKDCVIFIMYDTNGGQWDHVTPPVIDNWGPGTRVPLIVISPFAKKNFVDHNQYETVSLLAFIEQLYKLKPLNTRDRDALPPISAFMGQPDKVPTSNPSSKPTLSPG